MRSSLSLVVLGWLVAAACSTNRQENPVSHADGATADTLPGRETASASIEASPDRQPDQPTCTDYYPSDPKSCQESSCVRHNCDPFRPRMGVFAPQGGPLLAEVKVTRGPCNTSSYCQSGCTEVYVNPEISAAPEGGETCDLVAIATDGGSEAFSIRLVRKPTGINGGGICCAGSPQGYWYVNPTSYLDFEPSSVSLQFADDGGIPDSGDAAPPDTEVSGDSGQTDSNGDGSVAFSCGAPGADASTCTSGQFCVMSIAGIVGSEAQYRCATLSGDCVANPTCECLCPVPGNRSPGPGCIAVGAATNSCQCGIVRGVLTLMCGGI
jgi:hypothetical protein